MGLARVFTRSVTTTVDIDRPPRDVWAVLTGFAAYPQWNPQIREADGVLEPGRRVRFRLHPPRGRPVTIRPRVTVVEPCRELRLLGRLPAVFSGEHWFALEPLDGRRRTRLAQGETYQGLVVPFIRRTIAAAPEGFRAHNAALKRRVEAME